VQLTNITTPNKKSQLKPYPIEVPSDGINHIDDVSTCFDVGTIVWKLRYLSTSGIKVML